MRRPAVHSTTVEESGGDFIPAVLAFPELQSTTLAAMHGWFMVHTMTPRSHVAAAVRGSRRRRRHAGSSVDEPCVVSCCHGSPSD